MESPRNRQHPSVLVVARLEVFGIVEVATVGTLVDGQHHRCHTTATKLLGLGSHRRNDAGDLHIAEVQDVGGSRGVLGDGSDEDVYKRQDRVATNLPT